MIYSYQDLNQLPKEKLLAIRKEILDRFVEEERERLSLVADILRLQAVGSLYCMNYPGKK